MGGYNSGRRGDRSHDDEIVRLHGQGLTNTEIAGRLGMHRLAVGRALRRLGYPGARRGGEGRLRKRARERRILRLFREGHDVRDVAARVGMSGAGVRYVLDRLRTPDGGRAARDREIARLRTGGATLDEIGGQFGLTRQGVSLILIRLGIPAPAVVRRRPRKTNTRHDRRVRRLRQRGLTPREISRRVGLSYPTVTRILDRLGYPRPAAIREARNQQMVRLRGQALTLAEIARRHDLHVSQVCTILRGKGCPRPALVKRKKDGFASMDPARRRRAGHLGGKAAHAGGNGYRFTPDDHRAAVEARRRKRQAK